jgi:hypothetical protein
VESHLRPKSYLWLSKNGAFSKTDAIGIYYPIPTTAMVEWLGIISELRGICLEYALLQFWEMFGETQSMQLGDDPAIFWVNIHRSMVVHHRIPWPFQTKNPSI